MNPEIKTEWLEALRSGKYTQGRGWLHGLDQNTGKDEFCCLGVLCDIAVKHGVIDRTFNEDDDQYFYGTERESLVLPQEVIDWAGVSDSNPEFNLEGHENVSYDNYALADLNDTEGWTFEQIADVIEKRL